MLFNNAIGMRPSIVIARTLPLSETRDAEVVIVANLMRASNADLAMSSRTCLVRFARTGSMNRDDIVNLGVLRNWYNIPLTLYPRNKHRR